MIKAMITCWPWVCSITAHTALLGGAVWLASDMLPADHDAPYEKPRVVLLDEGALGGGGGVAQRPEVAFEEPAAGASPCLGEVDAWPAQHRASPVLAAARPMGSPVNIALEGPRVKAPAMIARLGEGTAAGAGGGTAGEGVAGGSGEGSGGATAAAGIGPGSGGGQGGGHGGGTGSNIGPGNGLGQQGKGTGNGAGRALAVENLQSPEYPRVSRERGEEGTVIVRIIVRADGSRHFELIQSSGHRRLDQAALEAARAATYHPQYANGAAIDTVRELPFVFQLRAGS